MALNLELDTKPNPEIEELMYNTVWGSDRGTRFLHRDTKVKITRLINPHFLSLKKGKRLLGAVAFSERNFLGTTGYYIRYFSLFESFRSRDASVKSSRVGKSNSQIKDKVKEFFSRGSFDKERKPAMFYAYVELENERSMNVCRDLGFEPIRKFSTNIFSRLKPKPDSSVSEIDESEKRNLRLAIKDLYKNYSMYYSNRLFEKNGYFVKRKNGDIVAGAQFTPVNWEIKSLPGFSGKILMKVIPVIPGIKKFFNPADYRFLGIDQVYYRGGHEKELELLFEAVMARKGYYSSIIWTDNESPLNGVIKGLDLGFMSRLKSDVPGDIIAFFANMNKMEIENYYNRPAYIGVYDLT